MQRKDIPKRIYSKTYGYQTQIVAEALNPEEAKLVFRNINEDTALGARHAAIMALFLDTGLRLSEFVNMEEEDAHLDQRYIKVMGKGAKERIIPE